MPKSNLLDEPEHWRERAEELIAMAESVEDAASREMMLNIAAGYEKLAQRAQERLAAALKRQSEQKAT